MIAVIATIELADGTRELFLKEFRRLVPAVRAEEGCIEYVPSVDVDSGLPAQPQLRSDVVTVLEKWADLDALQQHLQAPHMLKYREIVKDWVRGVTLHVHEIIEVSE